MYLHHLHVKNLKLLRDVSLDFTDGDGFRQWTVLVGRNGRGKTTLLQAIALAAAGSRRANGLAGPLLGSLPDRRQTAPALSIEATFDLPRLVHRTLHRTLPGLSGVHEGRVEVELSLTGDGGDLTGTSRYAGHPDVPDPLSTARGRELPFWFVTGYGVSRHIHPQLKVPDLSRPSLQRLAPLFGPEPIIGLGYATLFDDEKTSQFNTFLRKVIGRHDDITPDIDRLVVHGRGGIRNQKQLLEKERIYYRTGAKPMKIPAAWLSHGYQSTLAWLGDLVGQYLLEVDLKSLDPKQMTGLVLIDEIDLYLHPTWQRGFIRALSEVFPRLQFVATTHSPALLTAFRPDEVVVLEEDPRTGDIQRRRYTGDPRLMTGSELYEEFFDLKSLRADALVEHLRRHRFLAGDAYRTDAEDAELLRLDAMLRVDYRDIALSEIVERAPLPPLDEPA